MNYWLTVWFSLASFCLMAVPPGDWKPYTEVSYALNTEEDVPYLDTIVTTRYRPSQPINTDALEGIIASGIDSTRMKGYIRKLSSFSFEGRKQGELGEQKTADYIADHLTKEGLLSMASGTDKYFPYSFQGESFQQYQMSVWYKHYEFLEDFYAFQKSNRLDAWFDEDEVVFLGYGIDDPLYSDYKNKNIKGKVILIYPGEPLNRDSISYLTGTKKFSNWSLNWEKKLEIAHQYGVKSVIFIERSHKFYIKRYKKFLDEIYFYNTEEDISNRFAPSIYVSQALAAQIIGEKVKQVVKAKEQITNSGRPQSVKIPTKMSMTLVEKHQILAGNNVAHYMEGSDPVLKDEIILVSANHDSKGFNLEGLWDGADKNASGVAALMEMAKQLKNTEIIDIRPKRSIVLLSYSTGEIEHFGLKNFLKESIVDTSKIKAHMIPIHISG